MSISYNFTNFIIYIASNPALTHLEFRLRDKIWVCKALVQGYYLFRKEILPLHTQNLGCKIKSGCVKPGFKAIIL